ncbi:Aldo/keto reductase [Aureobasidium sp. EXF-12298]|nr:Aldo/keto reductase [Aureobasidium sp. EXF-12298]
MSDTEFKLNTGATIPALGLGTWQSAPGEVKNAVSHALKVGYKHIDAAYVYGNEDEVGEGLAEGFKSGLKREDIFVTTSKSRNSNRKILIGANKLWCTFHSRVEENLDLSLKSLGLDYVPMNPKGNHPNLPKHPDGTRDLDTSWTYTQTWKQMEAVLKTGKTKAIGVANFSVPFLEELMKEATVTPAANQIENHPYLPQQEIVDYCKKKGILITAYSPLGSTGSPLFQEKEIQEVAKKHEVSPGTVLLSYHIARGSSVIPKSVTPSRIEENMKLIKLDSGDMKALDNIAKTHPPNRFVYPAFGLLILFFKVNLGFPDKQ